MALLFMDGFDMGDYVIKGWVNSSNSSNTIASVAGRIGGGSAVSIALNSTGGTYTFARLQKLFAAATQITIGVALKVTQDEDNINGFFISLHGDGGTTQHLTIANHPTSKAIELRRGAHNGTLIASSSTSIPFDTWAYIEIQATINDAGGSCEIRLNGGTTPIINFAGDTKNGGTNNSIDMVAIGTYRGGVSYDATTVFDDLYILDGSGPTNTTFLGDVRIATLQPNAPGTDTQLTPTGSATNWQNVDEAPFSTTDYNSSATVGQRDTYGLTDLPATTTTVHGIQSNIVAAKSDATTANAKIPLRTGGNLYYGATTALSTSYLTYSDVYNVNPDTTTNWTPGDVDGLEAGMEVA